jgi:hypothetical protein
MVSNNWQQWDLKPQWHRLDDFLYLIRQLPVTADSCHSNTYNSLSIFNDIFGDLSLMCRSYQFLILKLRITLAILFLIKCVEPINLLPPNRSMLLIRNEKTVAVESQVRCKDDILKGFQYS